MSDDDTRLRHLVNTASLDRDLEEMDPGSLMDPDMPMPITNRPFIVRRSVSTEIEFPKGFR